MALLGQYVFAEMLGGYRIISPPGAMNGSPTVISRHFQNSPPNTNLSACLRRRTAGFMMRLGARWKKLPRRGAGQAVGYSDSPFRRAVIRVRAYCMAS